MELWHIYVLAYQLGRAKVSTKLWQRRDQCKAEQGRRKALRDTKTYQHGFAKHLSVCLAQNLDWIPHALLAHTRRGAL